ncbi:MAG TPA: substrate-binding domain-containing protein, partial [Lachnospiraceae bacterium]|nr:substrate-binding domain-containing protein [Lachnospiraceae bacterium]
MKVKRIAINICVITLAFLVFSLWYESSIRGAIQTTSNGRLPYKVYLITVDKTYQYWDILNEGASDMAASIGVNYVWDAPEVKDVNKQIEIIQRAVSNGANALLVAADDPKMISEVIEDAKARSVKVIYVDSPAY